LERMVSRFPEKEFIFTVSPIRHLKDGAHGNQISKSTLLLALEDVCGRFDNAGYFPSYEIMMDELRDYRFYAADMVHPSDQAVEYIWERFTDVMLPEGEKEKLLENEKLERQSRHRPLH
ncbi:MAG: GSCFA domain-containing protein, partial [Candidatus Cryptobacteroides sp.]|nr:GSCFA domain-containing protein [Candidatus Cryptobacteroides sp.]